MEHATSGTVFSELHLGTLPSSLIDDGDSLLSHRCPFGLAKWPDIPFHGGVAQGDLLIPVSDVDDAEGRVREHVGEERIAGNGRDGTHKRDVIRDEMFLRKHTESSGP